MEKTFNETNIENHNPYNIYLTAATLFSLSIFISMVNDFMIVKYFHRHF